MADWMADLQETKGSELTDAEKQNAADMFKEYEQKLKEAENYKVYLGNLKSFEQKEPGQFNQNDAADIPVDDDLPF